MGSTVIERLNKIYNELLMVFNKNAPVMVDLLSVIKEYKGEEIVRLKYVTVYKNKPDKSQEIEAAT
jgi:hypothetical protein